MNWDIAFIVAGYPPEYRFFDRHYFMVDVTEAHIESTLEPTRHLPEVVSFFANRKRTKFTAIGFRIDTEQWEEALKQALEQVEGFIDGLAILLDRSLPGWAYLEAKDAHIKDAWRKRCSQVFEAVNPFFDIVAGLHSQRSTALSRQLMYSMKLYRHGVSTGVYGLEFICKWSALEGLVCGGERRKKLLIISRLSTLFDGQEEKLPDLQHLWRLRNEAVHEARAFHSDHLHEANPLAIEIHQVENLFSCVVIFALAHIDRADSLQAL